jgi:very-short-patch-repair endonuclease
MQKTSPASTTASPLAKGNPLGVYPTAKLLTQITRGQLRAKLESGRWQRRGRGVIVTHNGPLTAEQRLAVALLTCAPGSAIAGLSALTLDGFEGFALGPGIQVVLPEGAAHPESSLVVPHWSTMLTTDDVHPLKQPRRTRPQRSLVDEAAWSGPPRRARAVILAGVQQGLARPSDLRDALSRRGPCRHRALIKESILDADGGVHSLPERDFELIRRHHGLPRPSRQQIVQRCDGHFFLDLGWKELDAAAEIHGIPHLEVLRWDADLLRANEIVIRGPRLLIFSSYAVRHETDQVAAQVKALLRRQGWRG